MPLGYDGTLSLLAVDPAGRPGDLAVLLDALDQASADASVPAARLAVLVAGPAAVEAAEQVRSRGYALALAVDDRGEDRFALAGGDDFARPIEELAPDLCAVRVRWHPDDDPDVKKAQALGLTKLGAWLHETDRDLLLELSLPSDEGDVDRTAEAVREIRDLGTEADLWSVPATADPDAVGELVCDEGRERVGIVVQVGPGTQDPRPRAASAGAAYRGVALSSSSWSEELAAVDAGARSHDEVARTIGDRLAAILTAAAPPA